MENWKQYVVIAIQLIMDAIFVTLLITRWSAMNEFKLSIYEMIGAIMSLFQLMLACSVIENEQAITTSIMYLLACGLLISVFGMAVVVDAAIKDGYVLF